MPPLAVQPVEAALFPAVQRTGAGDEQCVLRGVKSTQLVVVQSKEGMERLARCTRDFGAPTAVIVCADTSEAWTRKYDGKNISDIDASIVTDHMMLAAASLGLDTLWICMFKPEAVREEFALPANVEPVNILLIGYGDGPAADPNRHDTLRKPLSATVFHERF